ncbi:hypothetical protein [Amycolatopsis sp. CA-230715]|uniref:hypothetical protein n=1 Tax=Amycolatopsis sp. CA-230715 TaxID=2745196 RepID=UPI001C0282DB|nr:hypothetical protein [Amycolatopsis sp. CA-230715]QWF86044.1 hypothetical protein HUW46_09525 [Amycolatopsis sp. CA-230715]
MEIPAADLIEEHGLTLGFVFDPRYQRLLAAFGVRPSTSVVHATTDGFHARFGPWCVTTPLRNIRDAAVAGPFSPLKALGPRLSLVDRGLTFGSSTLLGVCVTFHEPVRGIDPLGLVKHPSLTVTAAEPQVLCRALRSVARSR